MHWSKTANAEDDPVHRDREIFDTAAEAQWKMRQAGHSGVNATFCNDIG